MEQSEQESSNLSAENTSLLKTNIVLTHWLIPAASTLLITDFFIFFYFLPLLKLDSSCRCFTLKTFQWLKFLLFNVTHLQKKVDYTDSKLTVEKHAII